MARAKGSLFSLSAHGALDGSLIYQVQRGRQCVKKYAKPSNPKTESQQENRTALSEAVAAWKALSESERAAFNVSGARYSRAGYNYFISLVLKGEIAIMSAIISPIGSIVAWAKSIPGTPALPVGWIECNGQTIADEDSPMNGQATPALNGADNRFLRGANVSGGLGGEKNHTLSVAEMPNHSHKTQITSVSSGIHIKGEETGSDNSDYWSSTLTTGGGGAHNTQPQYYDVVWIIKIK